MLTILKSLLIAAPFYWIALSLVGLCRGTFSEDGDTPLWVKTKGLLLWGLIFPAVSLNMITRDIHIHIGRHDQ